MRSDVYWTAFIIIIIIIWVTKLRHTHISRHKNIKSWVLLKWKVNIPAKMVMMLLLLYEEVRFGMVDFWVFRVLLLKCSFLLALVIHFACFTLFYPIPLLSLSFPSFQSYLCIPSFRFVPSNSIDFFMCDETSVSFVSMYLLCVVLRNDTIVKSVVWIEL